MHSFKDSEGRQWELTIKVGTIKAVRDALKIDLYKLIDDGFKPLAALLADPVQFVDALFVLCRDQAKEQHVTDEQFGMSLGGDSLSEAADAFMEELICFFPARLRDPLRRVTTMGKEVQGKMVDYMTTVLDSESADSLAKRLIDSSGKQRAQSASTPEPSRFSS